MRVVTRPGHEIPAPGRVSVVRLAALACLAASLLTPTPFSFQPAGAQTAAQPAGPATDARVQVRPVRRTVRLTGELEAAETAVVTAPNVRVWGLNLSYIVPDGARVEVGDVVARVDSSRLELERLDVEKRMEEARVQISEKEAEIDARRQDALLRVALARKSLEVARLYAGIDTSLIPRSDAEKYAFDMKNAELELGKAQEAVANLEKTAPTELDLVKLDFQKADQDLRTLRDEIESLSVKAPESGLVMVGVNYEAGGRPLQLGDKVFNGQPIMRIPDLATLRVRAKIQDADFADVRVGEPVDVVLDAAPDRRFKGEVASVSEAAGTEPGQKTAKRFKAEVSLFEPDLTFMKPGMTARVDVPVKSVPRTVVPRGAVSWSPDGSPSVLMADGRAVPVKVVDADERSVAVEGALREGEALLATSAAGRDPTAPVELIDIKRQDISFSVGGNGTIKAGRSRDVGPPILPRTWEFKIVQMAEDGAAVKKGDFLLQFDTSEIARRLQDESADLEKAGREILRVRASREIALKDLEVELEDARAQRDKTAGKLRDRRAFDAALKVKEAEFEAEYASRRAELTERKLASSRSALKLALQLLENKEKFHRERVKAYQQALAALTVASPADGVVIYSTGWRGEKRKVGDSVWMAETILSIPDLGSLMVRGQVAEVDSGKVKPGQKVAVTFDAIADQVFQGSIVDVADMLTQSTSDQPVKVLELSVALDKPDPARMRPGMAAKMDISFDVFKKVLAVPLGAIQVEGGKSFVWATKGGIPARREVRLGRNNGILAVVESGLQEGEKVSDRPLQP